MKASLATIANPFPLLAVIFLLALTTVVAQDQSTTLDPKPGSIAGSITIDGKPRAGIVVELLETKPDSSRRRFVNKVTT